MLCEHGAITYEYNNLGQKTSVTNGSQVVHYDYYANGWLKAVTDEYTYDGWGNLTDHTQHEGSVSQPYQYVGQLGYYTHVQDANLPLLQLGVRMYDPEIGRFGQVDPLKETSIAGYAYCRNTPSWRVDPSGRKSQGSGSSPPNDKDTDSWKEMCKAECMKYKPDREALAYLIGCCAAGAGAKFTNPWIGVGVGVIGGGLIVMEENEWQTQCNAYCDARLANGLSRKPPSLPQPPFDDAGFRWYQSHYCRHEAYN